MGTFSEIVELEGSDQKSSFTKPVKKFYGEDDINQLFESVRVSGLPQVLGNNLRKKSMKKPMRPGPYRTSRIGIPEPISLKQALRGLTISQASDMAATKRPSKPLGSSRAQPTPKPAGPDGTGGPKTSVTELGQARNLKMKLSLLSTRARNKPSLLTESMKQGTGVKKGEFSLSSKSSSLGECSSSTSFSCESNLSGRRASRPHMSKGSRWEAINSHGSLSLRSFKLIKKLGSGDMGSVYLGELVGSNCFFALKILENEVLGGRKKASRAQTEREILRMLDHPFLPTLFSQFATDKYSCLVTEYCPGGDLHVLRQKQPDKRFSEKAARFYVAEILLALEYLHMLGIVYRDLKPENILVKEDGHIMLTDFDLALRCNPSPTVLKPSSTLDRPKPTTEPGCIDPFCLQPPWQVPCFSPRPQPDAAGQTPQLVVEPTGARSKSFVGTHEYLAPEVIKGEGHGSPVDWWTLGVLLYELLYGRTPFKGTGDDETLGNVVARGVVFPDRPMVSCQARDLVRSLLRKRPETRLGAVGGAAEIRRHPFFEEMNWALIRCAVPPEMPKECDFKGVILKNSGFDMF